MNTSTVPSYTLDGEPVGIEEFISDNAAEDVAGFTEQEVACIRALQPGEAFVFGGGAAAEFVLRRDADALEEGTT